jgi:hypothetical protein
LTFVIGCDFVDEVRIVVVVMVVAAVVVGSRVVVTGSIVVVGVVIISFVDVSFTSPVGHVKLNSEVILKKIISLYIWFMNIFF